MSHWGVEYCFTSAVCRCSDEDPLALSASSIC